MLIEKVLLKFYKNVKFKQVQLMLIKDTYNLLKTFFFNIILNFSELNLINYYKDYNNLYLLIIKNINKLKILFENTSDIKINKFYKIIYIKKNILNLCNLISSNKISENLNLIDSNWKNELNNDNLNKFNFINTFIKSICFWDSNTHHIYNSSKENKNKIITISNNNNNIKNILVNSFNINETSEDANTIEVNNLFDINTCKQILQNTNIYIDKNKKCISLYENKFGCSIYINLNNRYIVIQGIFNDDLFNMALCNKWSSDIILNHENIINSDLSNILSDFKINYFKIINLRDKIVLSSSEIITEIKKKYNDFKQIQNKPLMLLINEFLLGSKFRKIDILTLFLISTQDDSKLACVLFDIFKSKDKTNSHIDIYNSLHYSIRDKLDLARKHMEEEEKELISINDSNISYEKKILFLQVTKDIKVKAMEKLKLIKNNVQGDPKAQAWVDGLLKIPFNIYNESDIISFKKKFIEKLLNNIFSDNEIEQYLIKENNTELQDQWTKYKINKKLVIKEIRTILDASVYGHKEAKLQLERIFAQWISGEDKGAIIGLQGPPGTGKTSLIKNGLSKCLKDINGNPRPFAFLPIGGCVNGSTLVGHNYTYVGSTWGRIVDILITTKCMNPIIFIDELDKVSQTENGREIISILTHLTDSTQNDEFEDKFFSGIKFDLSKVLIIFSFNDISLIDPILKDRITIIETKPFTIQEKIVIVKNYLLPDICKMVGFNSNEIILDNILIKYLIDTYTLEAGVRKIKEKIIEIIRDINLRLLNSEIINLPYIVTQLYCDELFALKPKIKIKKIMKLPLVGLVNGLFATSIGLGGITFIQAIKFPSDKMFELNLTGSIGDIMKESVEYSLKLVLSLIPSNIKDQLTEDKLNKKSFGIHLHCPEGGVKKNGSSAGAAITLALYSLLTNIKVDNTIALTGEIDLLGNITAIGGLQSKLLGAKNADIKLVLYPEENQDDIDIMRQDYLDLEDENFKLKSVNIITDVFNLCLIK